MQPSFKRFGVVGGFGMLLVLLIANAFVTGRQVEVQSGIEFLVSHAHQVLFELKQTELLLLQAESGKRGYLYTGDSEYLASHKAAIAQIDAQIDTLAKLTADNPRQQALIPVLRDQVHTRLAEMSKTIAFYQAGKAEAAREQVLTDTSRRTMDRIGSVIAQMENEENSLELARAAAYRFSTRRLVVSIYLATFLAIVGLVVLAFYILREIDLRAKYAQELQAGQEWLRVTLTSIGDAVIATDRKGAVTFLNPVAENLTGVSLSEARGKDILEVFPIFNEYTNKPAENPVKRVLESGHIVGLANHTVLKRKDGTQIPIDDSAAPIRREQGEMIGVVLVFRDQTSERKAREVMRKTEQLATAARLSATMAHEINNPLQAVGSLVFLARSTPGAPPEMVHQLDLVDQELRRVAHITQQTLGFFRGSSDPELVDIETLIESVFTLYANRFRSKAIRVNRFFGDCPPVYAASGELKQVISNLVANAADAVASHGAIAVTLGRVEKAGRAMLRIVVEDDGPGIPAENRQRIFEPFFTTKQDVGTGLGLWLSKEIVERHGGSIEVIPRAAGMRGAAFSILLPGTDTLPDGTAGDEADKALHG